MRKAIIDGKEYTGAFMHNQDGQWQENADGTWSTAVPLPLYTHSWLRRRYQCSCSEKFKTEIDYQIHYRHAHTDGKRYNRTPKGLVVL